MSYAGSKNVKEYGMKKFIITITLCIILFSATSSNSNAEVDKIKGCWEGSWGSKFEIGNDYEKNINNGDSVDILFKDDDNYIIMIMTHPEIIRIDPEAKEIFYIHKDSITEKTFRRSKEKESPDKGAEFTRIQCPK